MKPTWEQLQYGIGTQKKYICTGTTKECQNEKCPHSLPHGQRGSCGVPYCQDKPVDCIEV